MNRFLSPLSLLCALALPLAAHADTITTLDLSGFHIDTLHGGEHGGTAFGTVTFDSTTGAVQSIDFGFSDQDGRFKLDGSSTDISPAGNVELFEPFGLDRNHNNGFTTIDIVLPVNTLVGYLGGPICTTTNPCHGEFSIFGQGPAGGNYFTDGQLSPVPEPSSLILLGTGLIGIVGSSKWFNKETSDASTL